MSKIKTSFFCQNCGAQSTKWIGRCPSCGQWNTYVEELIQKDSDDKLWHGNNSIIQSKPKLINEINIDETPRIDTYNIELNRVLGGGLVPGSVILVGGEPGIGKSTLMLQIALNLKNKKILYISGEESELQIKMRAERLGKVKSNCYILTETQTQNIFQHIDSINPDILIIDSIQTLNSNNIESSAGSVSQIKECTTELLRFAKETSVPVFLIGHITKDGSIAGPKILEHIVDTVLHFEGDQNHIYRILRANKNRYGSTSEIGIYEMHNNGLAEVNNPSEMLIPQREEQLSGTAISATVEGIRPILIEVQALVTSATYGTPQRSSTGFDLRRLGMLLAVLEKRCGFRLGIKDIFLNIAGGLKVDDPAIDLAVISAILSSGEDISINSKICFAAEVGLSGEIRPVNRIDQRISEAEKLGFEKICISRYNIKGIMKKSFKIELVEIRKIEELYKYLFT
ncbi:MAG: DNA repair protein RadA [Bacteroidota bacterium]|nr:DNA repair protein RadA [Bacteroidota bacterium]